MARETPVVFVLIFHALLAGVLCLHGYGNHPDDCEKWQNIAWEIEQEERLQNASCQKNSACTGVDCTAIYTTGFQNQTYNVCFGLFVNPCDTPVDVSVYLEVPDSKIVFVRNYSDDEMTEIPGLQLQAEYMRVVVQVQGYLVTDLERYPGNDKVIRVGMRFRAKGQVGLASIHTISHWFKSMEVELVPDVNITVPNCTADKQMPRHKNNTCPAAYVPPVPKFPGGSNRTCDLYKWGSCKNHEKCVAVGTKNFCQCTTISWYNVESDECVLTMPSPKPHTGEGEPPHKSNTGKIAGAVGGTVMIIVVVVLIVLIVRYYRKRNPVVGSGNLQLRNEEMDED